MLPPSSGGDRMPGPIEVFISYAPRDNELRAELEEHLSVLRRQGLISAWHIAQVAPGQGWRTAIESHVSSAQLILLLVSASFFASDDCHDLEMAKALERWQRGEAQVIPILLSPCIWEETQLRRLQPLPDNRIAVTSWPSRNEAWTNVARGIRRVVERIAHGATAAMPGVAIVSSRQAPTIAQAPIHEPQRASAPSYPAMGPVSPRAPVSSQPSPSSGSARPSAPSAPSPSTPGAVASRPSAPALHAAQSATRPSFQPLPARPRRHSLLWAIAVAGVAVISVGVGAALIHSELVSTGRSELVEPSPVTASAAPPQTPAATAASWPGERDVPAPTSCPPPCCGGSECAVTAENTAKPSVCPAGAAQCKACGSGRTCISGPCGKELEPDRVVHLRLAHAAIRARPLGAGEQVCVRRGFLDRWSCMSCDPSVDSSAPPAAGTPHPGPPLAIADLTTWGTGIEIWVGSTPMGANPLASRGRASRDSIKVTELCEGLRFDLHEPADPSQVIGQVVFYLDDP